MKDYIGSLKVTVKGVLKTEEFEYSQYESVQDAVESLGEDAVLKLINRMAKTDARNQMAAKYNPRVLTEEQKLANKKKAAEDRELLAKIKANPELLASLGM
jgi:ferritin-like metal-binding protein YciE